MSWKKNGKETVTGSMPGWKTGEDKKEKSFDFIKCFMKNTL